MSKKFNDMKWDSVAVEGFPIAMTDKFQGFVGLEECKDYSLDKEGKKSKKNKLKEFKEKIKARKEQKKNRKALSESTDQEVPNKKVKLTEKPIKINKTTEVPNKKVKLPNVQNKKLKLSNGFVVETCNSIAPSATNSVEKNNKQKNEKKQPPNLPKNKGNEKPNKTKKAKNKPAPPDPSETKDKKQAKSKKGKNKKPQTQSSSENDQRQEIKKNKLKLGDLAQSESELTAEDMLSWAEFKLQEPIMKALTELGYKQPTKIQQLTLPAAIHGRRDILGAAETGSGKTLAFGLPIISGILKIKEKAALKGLDVYDISYKKAPAKKKTVKIEEEEVKKKKEQKKKFVPKKKRMEPVKESSEDGYSSGEESDKEDNEEEKEEYNDDDYLEEIEVPIKKRKENSADEGNDSDDENYIHLSDMLDSDDLADSDDDDDQNNADNNDESDIDGELNDEVGSETESGSENGDESDDNEVESDDGELERNDSSSEVDEELDGDEIDSDGDEGNDGSEGDDMDEEDGEEHDEGDENEQGIGCVKVIDNIEIPGHVSVKTGKPLYALLITPTRELAIQISRHLIAAAKYTGIKVATIVGGMAAVKQERVLRSGPEIVVATPGRLWELIGQGQPHLQQLDTVKFLAIDETDRMIERGHFDELYPLLERLNADEVKSAARQNFVFSATLTMVHDLPSHMKGKKVTKRGKIINRKIEKMTPQQKVNRLIKMIGMTEPKVVDITTQNSTAETLTESRIACALEHKDAYLYYILKRHPGRTIVFCNSIGSVRRLATLLTMLKCHPLPLHASMPQRQRLKNLERFRDDPHGVLIATDVAARGLDIPHVEHVIHYQVPRTGENYVHRSGRTARASREGLTILMMEPTEAYLYSKLCRTLNKTAELPTFPVDSQVLSPLKELVQVARELEGLDLKKRRTAQAVGWRERAAREMDIIIDDDVVPVTQVDNSIEKAMKAKRRQLQTLLTHPLYPRGFSFKYPTLNDPNALLIKEENALQVMKQAIESGQCKKEKRKSKNAPLLQLQKKFKKK